MVKVYLVDGDKGWQDLVDLPRVPVPGELFHFYGRQPELDGSSRVKAVIYGINTYRAERKTTMLAVGSRLEKILVVLEPATEEERQIVHKNG